MIIGIDNGVTGALVALSPHSKIIAMLPMPIQKARKGNEIDIAAVWEWIYATAGAISAITAIIEEPGGSKSSKAATSMAGSFHTLRALLVLKGIRFHRTTPQAWQKVMLPGCKSGDTKPRALSTARQLWPEETFLASDRCRTPHDGLIDAALIAEFARRTCIS
jgi:hypothetical protein